MAESKYKHLFFDLDRTLWDFERSALLTFEEMHEVYDIQAPFNEYYRSYQAINHQLWEQYKENRIGKEELALKRFELSLQRFGIDNPDLAKRLAFHYREHSPKKVSLFDGCHELLAYLEGRYSMHIITNGFEEIQFIKLERGGLHSYFQHVITSEKVGFKKPDPRIFEFALEVTGAKPSESLMIGDDHEVDILGAQGIGMDQALVHSNGQDACGATYCFPDLIALKTIL